MKGRYFQWRLRGMNSRLQFYVPVWVFTKRCARKFREEEKESREWKFSSGEEEEEQRVLARNGWEKYIRCRV